MEFEFDGHEGDEVMVFVGWQIILIEIIEVGKVGVILVFTAGPDGIEKVFAKSMSHWKVIKFYNLTMPNY
jgi:hypothetical protein